jgi:hypothetical protein
MFAHGADCGAWAKGGKADQISALQSLLRQIKQAGGFEVQQLIVGHGKC